MAAELTMCRCRRADEAGPRHLEGRDQGRTALASATGAANNVIGAVG